MFAFDVILIFLFPYVTSFLNAAVISKLDAATSNMQKMKVSARNANTSGAAQQVKSSDITAADQMNASQAMFWPKTLSVHMTSSGEYI